MILFNIFEQFLKQLKFGSNLIIEQIDDWGRYINGFWNTLFGQKGMKMTTDGYNYIAQDDDIYMYTGITSIVNDESNLGFVLTNLRTKETKFFDSDGNEIDESSEVVINAVKNTIPNKIGEYTKVQNSLDEVYYVKE